MQFKKISRITRKKKKTKVYNFHVPKYENFVANGMVSHNCYVARRKGYANPITLYSNRDQMVAAWKRHLDKLPKKQPHQTHETLWAYDLGCNNDISVDASACDTPRILIENFRNTRAIASFATKYVNRDMLSYDPQLHTRIRFSLMPESMRKVVDVSTSTTSAKIDAADEFVRAGYEVHFNFSPIIFVEGTRTKWIELFEELNDKLSEETKAQAAAELIMLTHNEQLHELNKLWHPRAEEMLWQPDLQEIKTSKNGQKNIRYEYRFKADVLKAFKSMLGQYCPWMKIRYAF